MIQLINFSRKCRNEVEHEVGRKISNVPVHEIIILCIDNLDVDIKHGIVSYGKYCGDSSYSHSRSALKFRRA